MPLKKIVNISYLLIFFTLLLLTSCSSVPLSTMIKLSTFDEQSLTQMAPEEINARITVNEFLDINLAETELGMSVENAAGELMLSFPLELISVTKNSEKNSFFSSMPASQTYLLQLAPEAIIDFETLKQQLSNSSENKFGFSVNAKLKKQENLSSNQQAQQLFMTIELKLNSEEAFFTLIDDVKIKNGKTDL